MSKRGRSAKTGKFVSEEYAKNHPDTTVLETRKQQQRKSNRNENQKRRII